MSADTTFLSRFNESGTAIESRMIDELDEILGHPPRVELPVGGIMFHENEPLDSIYILISGRVKLYQEIDGQEVIFHSQTVGKIIGLLALTRQSQSFFSCRAVTAVQFIKIRFDDLDRALQQSTSLQISFITVLLRSMARRNTRLVELQTEVIGQRDALSSALKELQQAQALLVESEKMATLGHLSAGVAHELNNPIAAINRAAEFVREDLLALTAEVPDGVVMKEILQRAANNQPPSSREQREARRKLTAELGDEALADKLVELGIRDPADYQQLAAQMPGTDEEKLARLHRYHQLGGALRNIQHCASRIAELVKSLRSYARTEKSEGGEINLHEGLDDTLRLFSNRLRDVTVTRQFGDIPLVHGFASELNQVWTNLIANALDAMKNRGSLTIVTACEDDNMVSVRVIDDGPGIPPEHIEKIFSLRFTTRQGRVEFGLGLGLSISQNIVARHGGTIGVESRPGRTEFCIQLPIAGRDEPATNRQEPAA
jgi:two-component system NtrC family sensor kinase